MIQSHHVTYLYYNNSPKDKQDNNYPRRRTPEENAIFADLGPSVREVAASLLLETKPPTTPPAPSAPPSVARKTTQNTKAEFSPADERDLSWFFNDAHSQLGFGSWCGKDDEFCYYDPDPTSAQRFRIPFEDPFAKYIRVGHPSSWDEDDRLVFELADHERAAARRMDHIVRAVPHLAYQVLRCLYSPVPRPWLTPAFAIAALTPAAGRAYEDSGCDAEFRPWLLGVVGRECAPYEEIVKGIADLTTQAKAQYLSARVHHDQNCDAGRNGFDTPPCCRARPPGWARVLLSIQETADLANLSRDTVARRLDDGCLDQGRIGKRRGVAIDIPPEKDEDLTRDMRIKGTLSYMLNDNKHPRKCRKFAATSMKAPDSLTP